jgi:hypothetical protein
VPGVSSSLTPLEPACAAGQDLGDPLQAIVTRILVPDLHFVATNRPDFLMGWLSVEPLRRSDRRFREPRRKLRTAREAFWEAYSAFVVAFREAAERLKTGDRTTRFPLGSFPPGLPFVSVYGARPP